MVSAQEFLDAAYQELGLKEGTLLPATEEPNGDITAEDWLNKGEWLALAKKVGAEKLFFVKDNPVLVFASSVESNDKELREAINRIWCMARPQSLFYARPGQLLVMDLTRPPIDADEPIDEQNRLLQKVESILEVQTKLSAYRRECLESGMSPESQGYFSPGEARADKALVRDLKLVREALMKAGLNGENTNALIGRSIFIRYLEDRRILLDTDFKNIAKQQKQWQEILESNQGVPIQSWMSHINYTRVLSDKDFTYAVFEQISQDFNGDLFPVTDEERQAVEPVHLHILQRFLRGEIVDDMPRLFFFAYRFELIPIELISSIYEEFYNVQAGTDNNQGTHYTPIELVEYLLSHVLTSDCLESNPTILDPACGSGIFLVEAFRRIVRFRQVRSKRRLGLPELRKIIRDQLRGIDINGEAVRVAAFSLYLALLDNLELPDIWREKRLPNLKYDPDIEKQDANRFDILLVNNAFTVDSHVRHTGVAAKFTSESVDVVVGNPPWGYPKKEDQKGVAEARKALNWCSKQGLEVGDRELSQAFIHRSLDFLKQGGRCALLVSSGVFFKHHNKSRAFRRQWLSRSQLNHIVNFSAVRHLYFNDVVAPFVSVVFTKKPLQEDENHFLEYWSAKHTLQAKQMRAVVLSLADRRLLRQIDAFSDDRIWKIFWWGNHLDFGLIQTLETNESLENIVGHDSFGQGFKEANKELESDWLGEFRELPLHRFNRYGPLPEDCLIDVPSRVERRGVRKVYEGTRILVKRGITQKHGHNGQIEARLEGEPFAFRNSIHGISLKSQSTWKSKVLLGILWSSLARYYFWMTAGSWGMWHHEIHEGDLKRLPIVWPRDLSLRNRIIQIVDKLRRLPLPEEPTLFVDEALEDALIANLDELVFECYGLVDSQRQLIKDMCNIGLDLFYRHWQSKAVQRLIIPNDMTSGIVTDVDSFQDQNDLGDYLKTLLEIWNQEIAPDGEFVWHVVRPMATVPMIAVILATEDRGAIASGVNQQRYQWDHVLRKLDEVSVQHNGSKRVFIDGVIRSVGETEIIIIKRNERRLWTGSVGREDAEATIKMAMHLQQA